MSDYQPGSIGVMFPECAAMVEGLLAERNALEAQLGKVHVLVARYRKVSDAPSQQCYLRDVEIALGLDLPPVVDRDGRTNW